MDKYKILSISFLIAVSLVMSIMPFVSTVSAKQTPSLASYEYNTEIIGIVTYISNNTMIVTSSFPSPMKIYEINNISNATTIGTINIGTRVLVIGTMVGINNNTGFIIVNAKEIIALFSNPFAPPILMRPL